MKLSQLLCWTLIMSCNRPDKFFTSMHSSQTHIDFANNLESRPDLGILTYLYYHNGGGVAVGDINNDGLPDIYFTANQGGNKLYLNKGKFKFEDISAKAGIEEKGKWNTGVVLVDINNDGW